MASLAAFSTAVSTIGTVASAVMAADQANRAAARQIEARNREYAMQAQQTKLQHETEERRRRQGLKEALATRRARFGSAGIGAGAGSAAALIAGLQRKSAKAGAEAAEARQLGLQAGLLSAQNSNRRALQNASFARENAGLKAALGLSHGVIGGLGHIEREKKKK